MHPNPTSFDGMYQGAVVRTMANPGSMGNANGVCPTPGQAPGSLTVQNGQVMWSNGGSTLPATVMADGSFQTQSGSTFFAGKITNRSMVARGNIAGCHTVYDLTKPAT